MAEDLTAEYRLTIKPVTAGLTHLLRTFVEASPSILAASGYFVWNHNDVADIDSGDAAQALWTALKGIYDADVVAPDWLLENRDGVVWNPVAGGTLTGAGTATGTVAAASQLTVSLRTETFKRIKLVILESNNFSAGVKYDNFSEFESDTSLTNLAHTINGADSDAAGYFQWARSRNKKKLHLTAPFVSATYDLNDKVRRARHVM
jgi:hypothetical protein